MATDSQSENVGLVSSTVLLAEQIARRAHANQFRRDGATPYITHPEAIVKKLAAESDDVKAVAWLHDVLEDTSVTATELLDFEIPRHVVDAIVRLTKVNGQSYDSYLEGVRGNEIACKVKVVDMLHNLSDNPSQKQILKYAHGLIALLG